MAKRTTIKDVAKKLMVTTSTVSRALSNHPTISEKTKIMVRKAAREMDYKPNNIAASLRTGRGNTIGVIIPKINSRFMSNCIFGIESATYLSDYNLIICQSNERFDKEVNNIKTLINSQVSGMLMSFSNETNNSKHLKLARENNVPVVLFDRVDNSSEFDCIVNNDYLVSKQVIDHLHEEGCKSIAIFCGPTNLSVYKNRLDGFIDGIKLNGLPLNQDWIFKAVSTKEKVQQLTLDLFKNVTGVKPDAIVCTGDFLALGAISAINELGLKIPTDVAITGFANDSYSDLINPSLTTVEQYPQEIGFHAAKTLINIIEEDFIKRINKTISVQSKLIIRESSMKSKYSIK